MYKVKATDHRGAPVTYACGTPDQAYEKVLELTGQRFGAVRVVDPAGKEYTGAAFKAMLLNGEI
jgi:hypothetical protein